MKPYKPLQWDRAMICREFGMDVRTVGKRLADAQLGDKSSFSTQQVCSAVFGDMDGERLRLIREQADKLAIENQESRRELIPASDVREILEKGFAAIRSGILAASNLEREDRDKLINHLRECGAGVVRITQSSDSTTQVDG